MTSIGERLFSLKLANGDFATFRISEDYEKVTVEVKEPQIKPVKKGR